LPKLQNFNEKTDISISIGALRGTWASGLFLRPASFFTIHDTSAYQISRPYVENCQNYRILIKKTEISISIGALRGTWASGLFLRPASFSTIQGTSACQISRPYVENCQNYRILIKKTDISISIGALRGTWASELFLRPASFFTN
jgi:hypothetical protein